MNRLVIFIIALGLPVFLGTYAWGMYLLVKDASLLVTALVGLSHCLTWLGLAHLVDRQ